MDNANRVSTGPMRSFLGKLKERRMERMLSRIASGVDDFFDHVASTIADRFDRLGFNTVVTPCTTHGVTVWASSREYPNLWTEFSLCDTDITMDVIWSYYVEWKDRLYYRESVFSVLYMLGYFGREGRKHFPKRLRFMKSIIENFGEPTKESLYAVMLGKIRSEGLNEPTPFQLRMNIDGFQADIDKNGVFPTQSDGRHTANVFYVKDSRLEELEEMELDDYQYRLVGAFKNSYVGKLGWDNIILTEE